MMKKTMVLLISLIILLISMTACSGFFDSEPTSSLPEDSSPSAIQTACDLLDDLADLEYSNIKIDIVVTIGFAELYSKYVLTQSTVIYSIERLNLWPTDGNITDLPSNYKMAVTGYALIKNGQVIELDGNNDVTLPSYDELKGKFHFEESNFKNIVVGLNAFEAEVVSPSKFYGTDVVVNDLKVKVEYTQNALTNILISYTTANSTVQTMYTFT